MKNFYAVIMVSITIFLLQNCNTKSIDIGNLPVDIEQEKSAILECLNGETKAAFQRDYPLSTTYWSDENDISKTYLNSRKIVFLNL